MGTRGLRNISPRAYNFENDANDAVLVRYSVGVAACREFFFNLLAPEQRENASSGMDVRDRGVHPLEITRARCHFDGR